MKVNFWNISEIDNDNGGVLNFSSSENFEVDSLVEKIDGNKPSPNQNDNNSPSQKGKEGISNSATKIAIAVAILTILGLVIALLAVRKRSKK